MNLKKIPKYNVYFSNKDQEKLNRLRFSKLLLFYKKEGYRLIYIDETGVTENLHPERGWGIRGKKLIQTVVKNSKEENISLIVAVEEEKVLAYQFIHLGVRGGDFFSFILGLVKKENLLNKKYLFIIDNGRMHINRLFKKADIFFIFFLLPSYCPYLNAAEYFFCYLKRILRYNFYKTRKELINTVIKTVKNLSEDVIRSFFREL